MPKWIDLNEVDDDLLLGRINFGGKSVIQEQLAEKVSTYYQPDGGEPVHENVSYKNTSNDDTAYKEVAAYDGDEYEGYTPKKYTFAPDDDEIPIKKFNMSGLNHTFEKSSDYETSHQATEMDFLDAMEPAKKSMTIFFLIDVSKSMKGTKIGSLNSTMEELLPSLVGVGEATTDVKVAVMKFSTKVEWMTPQPVRIEEYQHWNRLEPEGLTFMGDAFLELSKKLSRNSFLNSPSLSFAPVIFLLSDGTPNDNWQKGLASLQENKWFQYGLKIALGIGSEVDMDVLRAFTGNDELAVQAKTADQLRELVKLLAVTSSQIGSRSLALVDDSPASGTSRPTFHNDYAPASGAAEASMSQAKQRLLVQEIREGTKDILGEAVDLDSVNFDEGW